MLSVFFGELSEVITNPARYFKKHTRMTGLRMIYIKR